MTALRDALAIARFHIVLVATLGMLTFGWLMSGAYLGAIAACVAIDWFLINLFNRITDLAEDRRNGVPGTERVARNQGLLMGLGALVFVTSFAATGLGALGPARLVWARLAVQAMGVAYNYPVVGKRWKEVYAWKNLASALIFVLTCFVYPALAIGGPGALGTRGLVILAVFFVLFELTYEIFYDLRDLDGDRLEGVPTFPVVHGFAGARRIIDGLLVLSGLTVVGGVLVGALGLREGLFVAAPAVQWGVMHRRLRRVDEEPLSAQDGIGITHLGSALLAFFLAGTALWLRAGLPADLYPFR